MINKKIMIISAAISGCFAINAMAKQLSPETIQICKNYISNPTQKAGEVDAAALEQCYKNKDQLINIPNSAHQLGQWKLNYIPPTVPKTTTTVIQQAAPAPGTAIPPEFHSTHPGQPIQTPSYQPQSVSAPATYVSPQTEQPTSAQPTPTQPEHTKKPSINWF